MAKTAHVSLRLDPDLLAQIDSAPGTNRTEKVRYLLAQRGIVSALLDDQKAMLSQVQKVVANLHQQPKQNQPAQATQTAPVSPAYLAAIFQALALVSGAVGKPAMSSEAANFGTSKVREILALQ